VLSAQAEVGRSPRTSAAWPARALRAGGGGPELRSASGFDAGGLVACATRQASRW